MAIIFWFSSRPAAELPNFSWADGLIKKSSHAIGYAALAYCYWYGLKWREGKRWLVWLLAILYACTDEYHQLFVSGRGASVWDVVIFDNVGILVALWSVSNYINRKRSGALARSLQEQ